MKIKIRMRSKNFTEIEKEKLLEIVNNYNNIIENKKTDAVTVQEKIQAWKMVAEDYNSFGLGPIRDFKNVIRKH